MESPTRRYSGVTWWIVVTIGLAVIYFPLIQTDPWLHFDDPLVAGPISRVSSLSNYFAMRGQGLILDVQPVRDFTYYLDFLIGSLLGFKSFHLTQVLIWAGVAFLVRSILLLTESSPVVANALSLLFAFNPIFVSSVAWISSRKHLLAALFTSMATMLVLRLIKRRGNPGPNSVELASICLLYFLSCFSQPINLFWPISAFLLLTSDSNVRAAIRQSWNRLPLLLSSFALGSTGVLCAFANLRYYSTDYVVAFRTGKYTESQQDTLYWKMQALGRYFFQAILPLRPNIWDHDPASPLGWVGFTLIVAMGAFLFVTHSKKASLWLLYFMLSLVPVLVRMTNVFCADNYLLNASIGIYVILSVAITFALQKWPGTAVRASLAVLSLLLVLTFVSSSRFLARAWQSDFSLWKAAYELEPTAKNRTSFALQLLKSGRPSEALNLATEAYRISPHEPHLSFVLSKSTYLRAEISTQNKISLLQHYPSDWSSYFQAALWADVGNFQEADLSLREVILGSDHYIFEFGDDLNAIATQASNFCTRAGRKDCSILSEKINRDRQRARGLQSDSGGA